MITIRPAQERGIAQFSWLDSRHTFSFGHYYHPDHLGFSHLRVINEDKIQPKGGFPTHGHRDMEIITYVIAGALEHKDSLGNGSMIRPGDVQRMSAGTGIMHSEFNPSEENPVHLLQIWLIPDTQGLDPSYEQKHFELAQKQGQWRLIGSRDGRQGSVTIHQDVNLYTSLLGDGETLTYSLAEGRKAWLQVVQGFVTVNEYSVSAGDGVAIAQEPTIVLQSASENAEVLLFDMK